MFFLAGKVEGQTSKKLKGFMDLGITKEVEYEIADAAIITHRN